MSRPVLVVKPAKAPAKATPHLLPCRVHHDGAVGPTDSYWRPTQSKDGLGHTAYFRGRKLHGRTVPLPDGYTGLVAETVAAAPAADAGEAPDLERGEEPEPELGGLEVRAGFDDVVVWGHDTAAEAATVPHVRAMEEWLDLADKIHSFESFDTTKRDKTGQ
ncbi:hypothetical protein P8C59_005058 [Phyllachora maydis]|uniref:Uncharacterized protein n=1 Tax=Phyllachora maydis TaxID=1825666 RepID=A0AAD9I441_9PEZI|nr:hypothetical protein P8C59_005058 [Phyllachora maydis]